ncbi:hypothetical protein J11TS1_20550 [Oceanobacillus sp. J11TS1]|nr:hypothetical protein J11TS1_20550 [Oceanobacillus sp. J11TS1]
MQFIFLLCVKKDSQEDLQEMYEMLGEIIDNSTMVKRLIQARNYKEFVGILQ